LLILEVVTMSNRTSLGVMFLGTLVLSWTLVTAAIGLAIWSDRETSLTRLATWASLWLFTVVAPTLNAFAVHRSLAELAVSEAGGTPIDQLARLRPVLLLTANMAVLSAFALIFGR
jgi:hypothetical protein